MASQPRINSALVAAIRMAKLSKSTIAGPTEVHQYKQNEDRPDKAYTTERAQKAGKANAASGKIFVTVPPDHFGPIPAENDPQRHQGVLVGECWEDRMECRQWGAHLPHVSGIAGQSGYGAQSVALSGGYQDDEDHGEWFLYTGSGGRDLSGNKRTNKDQSFDQKFEKMNEALRVSCKKGYPVRVVRSHKEKRSSYAPEKGVRYDGVYRIEKCWRKPGIQGFKVCRYLFVRCDNEPAPWTSDEYGDRPRPLPSVKELKDKKLKDITDTTDRKESPSWDFDEEDGRWKWKKPPPLSQKRRVETGNPEDWKRSRKIIRQAQNSSVRDKLLKEFSCLICSQVMSLPITTPCGHNFCKVCLEGAFAGKTLVRERSRGGRTLRSQKNIMLCPSCPTDISDFLQNLQVNRELMDVIESLKCKTEEIAEDPVADLSEEENSDPADETEAERACKRKKVDTNPEGVKEAEGAQKEDSPSSTLQIQTSDEDLKDSESGNQGKSHQPIAINPFIGVNSGSYEANKGKMLGVGPPNGLDIGNVSGNKVGPKLGRWKRWAKDGVQMESGLEDKVQLGKRTVLVEVGFDSRDSKLAKVDERLRGASNVISTAYYPDIIFLIETKTDRFRMENVRVKLGFSGDFNEILDESEKLGGVQRLSAQIHEFRSTSDDYGLQDIAFVSTSLSPSSFFFFEKCWADSADCAKIVKEAWSKSGNQNNIQGLVSSIRSLASIKSGYHLEMSLGLNPRPLGLSLNDSWWKYLWRIKIPAEVKLLLWRASHDWVPVYCNLAKRADPGGISLKNVPWIPPKGNLFKVNTDVAIDAGVGRVGFGIIIRDMEGSVMASSLQLVRSASTRQSFKVSASNFKGSKVIAGIVHHLDFRSPPYVRVDLFRFRSQRRLVVQTSDGDSEVKGYASGRKLMILILKLRRMPRHGSTRSRKNQVAADEEDSPSSILQIPSSDEISEKAGGVKDDLPNPAIECEEAERACKRKKADDTEAVKESEGAQKEDSPYSTLQIQSSDEDLY
ncbi:hypothetical protein EZV62_023904 [Acer yangbiense]|uniref:RING-type E3 ubiquitin transferase n=1 Tax=Acer yangbiense TaxID=1000413 RepID=A0A5C7H315_9ROSI|nr:hypothetical protein EZV62_023904 [Acer yangbiense]